MRLLSRVVIRNRGRFHLAKHNYAFRCGFCFIHPYTVLPASGFSLKIYAILSIYGYKVFGKCLHIVLSINKKYIITYFCCELIDSCLQWNAGAGLVINLDAIWYLLYYNYIKPAYSIYKLVWIMLNINKIIIINYLMLFWKTHRW